MAQNHSYFPSMINRHNENNVTSRDTFFNPLTITHSNDFHSSTSQKGQETIDPSVKRIFAVVHKNLDDNRIAKIHETRLLQPEETKEVESEPFMLPSTFTKIPKYKENFSNMKKNDGGNLKSIPQMKARLQQKLQQHIRKTVQPNEPNNYTNQQRLQEVIRQKHILKEILEEHAKIQRDRNSISAEIRTMKEYLTEIRCKLDSSLKKLGAPKLMEENLKLKKKAKLLNTKQKRGNEKKL